ncbi:gamma-glutamylcyclotransferase family protein [Lyngbya confervoides]|uniref:Gamma-glutamylcyclotransferase n=1 Tax=Lyngbya confervoides BDU141951 TaxID=1574623 RepID=A0ABD4T6B0_9CYAN|nr:gamma-glutamylcyclotransferase family protein [Lyngbya confervoides]MCM1984243.1 gamma-glutamylcyclotransferase [Lyngbya confervoides BDU141951]
METLQLFVYGTLQPGHQNYDHYCRHCILAYQPAQVKGQLYHLPQGYPGMIAGDQWIQGYLLTVPEDPQWLIALDALEDYRPGAAHNLYERVCLEVFDLGEEPLGLAWAYQMAAETVQRLQGEIIPSGRWYDTRSKLG